MKVHLLSDSKMRELGFTDHIEDHWYLCKRVSKRPDITFNITIPKDNPDSFKIDVLDEAFLQPYDYQYFMEIGKKSDQILEVYNNVNGLMLWLQDKGVISGYKIGDYI